MKSLVVGTDRRTLLSMASDHASTATTTPVPSGLRHAVPRGARVALCGEAPALRWDGEPWPGPTAQQDVCPLCRRLALKRERR